MNSISRSQRVSTVLIMLVLCMPLRAALQEKTAEKPASAAAQAAKPGATEMERLKFYLGEWDYTETYTNGGKNTGVYTSKLGPGGNSLINAFHSQGPVGDFEGLLVMTWERKRKRTRLTCSGMIFPGPLCRLDSSRATRWFIALKWLLRAQR